MFNQRVGEELNGTRYDLIQFVQSQVDAMIADAVFREIVGANPLATIARSHETLALISTLLVFLLLKVVI